MKARSIKLLIREADQFLSDAKVEKDPFLKSMYIKASIAFSWFGLEGTINLILSDFILLKNVQLLEKAFMEEKNIEYNDGDFSLGGRRYHTTQEKLLFLLRRFGNYQIKKSDKIWIKLRNLKEWRDALVHPKEDNSISTFTANNAEIAIDTSRSLIKLLYNKIYKKTVRL